MPLFLSNEDQAACISAAEAIDAMENGIRQMARGDAIRRPRIDNLIPTTRPDEFFCFSSMEGGLRSPGYYALRIKPDVVSWPVVDGVRRRVTYAVKPGLYAGLVLLYAVDNAELLAIMNDGYIQHVRVAATAGLGIRYLAHPEAKVMGLLGSGGMARTFALAARAERPIERIQVYSPSRAHVEAYLEEMAPQLDCELVAVDTPDAAARDADILSLCTNSMQPVVQAEWLRPGMHVTNVTAHELPPEGYARIDVAGLLVRRTPMSLAGFVDDDFDFRTDVMSYAAGQPEERARIPAGSQEPNRYPNARFPLCCDWQTGQPYHRERPDEITTLASWSLGVLEGEGGASVGPQGLQFACVAGKMYERAKEQKRGTELPAEMFLQDIPT